VWCVRSSLGWSDAVVVGGRARHRVVGLSSIVWNGFEIERWEGFVLMALTFAVTVLQGWRRHRSHG